MRYYLNLFSPETYEAFSRSGKDITGFRARQWNVARRVVAGDRFLCYMTKLSRWIGVLEIIRSPYEDDLPVFYEHDDPFIVRFEVRPLVWLEKDKAVPIRTDALWNSLSFTKGYNKSSSTWTGKLRASLSNVDDGDAKLIEETLLRQATEERVFEVDDREYQKLVTHRIRRLDKVVSVSVPQDVSEADNTEVEDLKGESRESLKIQALVADIGAIMGFRIWLPRNDKARVQALMATSASCLLENLPLNYDETTIKTIEQIDVLWLKGRSIARAFEVEHSTTIYSGILRMADLLALQPNMDIKLHIVAPYERKEKVFTEIRRPVFSLLDRGPLADSCTFISYDGLTELARQRHLQHLSDSVLDEYAEDAE